MGALLMWVGQFLLAGFIARIFVGAGLAFITYQGLDGYLEGFINAWASTLGGMPQASLTILTIAGLVEAVEIITSAMLSTMAIVLAGKIMGIKWVGGA